MSRAVWALIGALVGAIAGACAGFVVALGASTVQPGQHTKSLDPLLGALALAGCTLLGAAAGGALGWRRGAGLVGAIAERLKRGADDGYLVAGGWLGALAGAIGLGLLAAYVFDFGAVAVVACVVAGLAAGAAVGVLLGATWSALSAE